MGLAYSLRYLETNNKPDDCKHKQDILSERNSVLSDSGLLRLHKELLKNKIHNNQIDVKRMKYNNMLLRQMYDIQSENVLELQLENDMLKKSLEKYKNLYRQLTIK
jgi:hypothetical protein